MVSYVAIMGGLGAPRTRDENGLTIRYFASPRDGGRGELPRLETALRAGKIHKVVVRVRWNSHSATTRIKRLCRLLGVEIQFER